jgi:very-short-patch-repair endonuclease
VNSSIWKPTNTLQLRTIHARDDIWFSSPTLATLFGVTTQNIQMHLRDLLEAGQPIVAATFSILQKEGSRTVKRGIKHYPFEAAHAIAMRSQRFDELRWLLELASAHGTEKTNYRIAPIKERAFGKLLCGALDGVTSVMPQHHVPPYFIDFFLPDWTLAVEYDERQHASPRNRDADAKRQARIEQVLGVTFVRVTVGREIEGLNQILRLGYRINGGAR